MSKSAFRTLLLSSIPIFVKDCSTGMGVERNCLFVGKQSIDGLRGHVLFFEINFLNVSMSHAEALLKGFHKVVVVVRLM